MAKAIDKKAGDEIADDFIVKSSALPCFQTDVVSPAQLRAARAFLGWDRGVLAQTANLSTETIKNIEHGTFRPKPETNQSIVSCFQQHGIEFLSLLHLKINTLSGNEMGLRADVKGVIFVSPTQYVEAET